VILGAAGDPLGDQYLAADRCVVSSFNLRADGQVRCSYFTIQDFIAMFGPWCSLMGVAPSP
jgi:hypothetical protein